MFSRDMKRETGDGWLGEWRKEKMESLSQRDGKHVNGEAGIEQEEVG